MKYLMVILPFGAIGSLSCEMNTNKKMQAKIETKDMRCLREFGRLRSSIWNGGGERESVLATSLYPLVI